MAESPINCHCAAFHISYEVILHQYANNINRYFRATLFLITKKPVQGSQFPQGSYPF